MTDREAVRIALFLAIEWERSLIGSMRSDESEVMAAHKRISAFERVLDRRYGGWRGPQVRSGESISLADLLASGRREFDPDLAIVKHG